MCQDKLFVWKSHCKWLGCAQIWVGQGSGDHQGRANSVNQVNGDSDMAPACQLCAGRAHSGIVAFASTSVQ